MDRVPLQRVLLAQHPPVKGVRRAWNAWSDGGSLLFSLDQAGQKRIKLGCLDHIIQGDAIVYRVSRLFIARTKANRGNSSLARPVDPVRGEVPLADRGI